ncbi:MAG: ATP synthase subunit C [Defluviitaleaceae bacterium]|nr:ATP synthase subunit C [Defluviitaleaceae bacterium]
MLILIGMFLTAIVAPMGFYYIGSKRAHAQGQNNGHKNIRRGKLALVLNLGAFTLVFLLATVLIFTGRVHAAEPAAVASDLALAAAFIGAGLVTGLGAIGTGIAVSSATAAAIGAISENENNFGKSMIFVAMAEGIAIYGLLISFMILGRV